MKRLSEPALCTSRVHRAGQRLSQKRRLAERNLTQTVTAKFRASPERERPGALAASPDKRFARFLRHKKAGTERSRTGLMDCRQ